MRAVILGGGAGQRLAGEPKSLLPFGSTRLIQIQIRQLAQAGYLRPIIIAERRALELADLVGNQAMVIDTYGLGTRHGLLMGLALAKGPTLIVHGDILTLPHVFAELNDDEAVVLWPREAGKLGCVWSEGLIRALGTGDWQWGGVFRLSEESVHMAIALLAASQAQEYWEALGPLFRDREIRAVQHHHTYFIDIDTAEDSLRAHREVWPLVKVA